MLLVLKVLGSLGIAYVLTIPFALLIQFSGIFEGQTEGWVPSVNTIGMLIISLFFLIVYALALFLLTRKKNAQPVTKKADNSKRQLWMIINRLSKIFFIFLNIIVILQALYLSIHNVTPLGTREIVSLTFIYILQPFFAPFLTINRNLEPLYIMIIVNVTVVIALRYYSKARIRIVAVILLAIVASLYIVDKILLWLA